VVIILGFLAAVTALATTYCMRGIPLGEMKAPSPGVCADARDAVIAEKNASRKNDARRRDRRGTAGEDGDRHSRRVYYTRIRVSEDCA
jgi:hypothetical protein